MGGVAELLPSSRGRCPHAEDGATEEVLEKRQEGSWGWVRAAWQPLKLSRLEIIET